MEIAKENWLSEKGIAFVENYLKSFLSDETENGRKLQQFQEEGIGTDSYQFCGLCCSIYNVKKIKYDGEYALKVEYSKPIKSDFYDEYGELQDCFMIIKSFEELSELLSFDGFLYSKFNSIF